MIKYDISAYLRSELHTQAKFIITNYNGVLYFIKLDGQNRDHPLVNWILKILKV